MTYKLLSKEDRKTSGSLQILNLTYIHFMFSKFVLIAIDMFFLKFQCVGRYLQQSSNFLRIL